MIYFDNAATTRVSDAAAKKALEVMTEQYGNPSSVHDFGYEAEKILNKARRTMLSLIGADRRGDDFVFTSGGTEANNLAVFGALSVRRHGGKTVFFSDSEHASLYLVSRELLRQGYRVEMIPTRGGKLDLDWCERMFSADTVLISCMYANNETGALYDLPALNALRRRLCPDAVLHTDGVQAFGKIRTPLALCGADLISVSGHKIHAPKGVGGLYIRAGVRIGGLLFGGGQEKNIRPGTEALPNIAAFAEAGSGLLQNDPIGRVEALRAHLIAVLRKGLPEITVNVPESFLPHVVSLTLPSIKSEVMLRYLSAREIYISAGSACSAKHRENRVLNAFGLSPKEADCTIRVSFCETNTEEEIDLFAAALSDGIGDLIAMR